MKKKPVKVRLIGKKANSYQIKFPNLQIPVEVNENLYKKMLRSSEYQFKNPAKVVKGQSRLNNY